jgi:hypothetical protein
MIRSFFYFLRTPHNFFELLSVNFAVPPCTSCYFLFFHSVFPLPSLFAAEFPSFVFNLSNLSTRFSTRLVRPRLFFPTTRNVSSPSTPNVSSSLSYPSLPMLPLSISACSLFLCFPVPLVSRLSFSISRFPLCNSYPVNSPFPLPLFHLASLLFGYPSTELSSTELSSPVLFLPFQPSWFSVDSLSPFRPQLAVFLFCLSSLFCLSFSSSPRLSFPFFDLSQLSSLFCLSFCCSPHFFFFNSCPLHFAILSTTSPP